MRSSFVVLLGVLAVSLVCVTAAYYFQSRSYHVVQIADVLGHSLAYNNTVVQLQGRLEPHSPEPWSSGPLVYGLLRDRSGAIVLRFSGEYPLQYAYGELSVTGKVRYEPRAYVLGLWLYVEVSSYEGSEAQLRLELRKTGGVEGVNELLVAEPDGSGTFSRAFMKETAFNLSTAQVHQLRALIIGNSFADVEPENFDPGQGVADYFAHSLSVTYLRNGQESGRKTVSWVDEWALEGKLPESLRQIQKGLDLLITEILESEVVDERKVATTAISLLRNSTTFQFDGIEESLTVSKVTRLVNEPPTQEFFWVVEVAFVSAHPGHGNRSGMILAQVITEHGAVVSLDGLGNVITALCDREWDILGDKEVLRTSTTFIAVVSGAGRLEIPVAVGLRDGISETEAKLIADETFTAVMGEKVLGRLDKLNLLGDQLQAHYTWGYSTEDLGHVFDMTAELGSGAILVTHCR